MIQSEQTGEASAGVASAGTGRVYLKNTHDPDYRCNSYDLYYGKSGVVPQSSSIFERKLPPRVRPQKGQRPNQKESTPSQRYAVGLAEVWPEF